MSRWPARTDAGQLMILVIGYALIAAALVVVVVDASAFFLARRSLGALADGAAVAGTRAEDQGALYGGGALAGGRLPLAAAEVRLEVSAYLAARDADPAYPNLALAEASTDGVTVNVVLTSDKPLPFLRLVNRLTGAFPGGTARVQASARAQAPVRP